MLTVLYSYYPTFDHFVSNARRHFVFQVDFFDPTFDSDMIFGGCGALIFVIDAQVCNFTGVLRTSMQFHSVVIQTFLALTLRYAISLAFYPLQCSFHNVVIQTFLSLTFRYAISLVFYAPQCSFINVVIQTFLSWAQRYIDRVPYFH